MTQEKNGCMVHSSPGVVPGLILAAMGVLFLLNNLGVVHIYDWWQLWPTVLIAIGATKLADAQSHTGKAHGALLIIFGGIFLGASTGFFSWQIWQLWPLALIGLGAVMLVERIALPERGAWRFSSKDGALDGFAFFSGFKRRVVGEFRGGDYFALFGGGDLNLRQAEIPDDAAVITVNAVFGGMTIKVPAHWHVVDEITGIFGGSDNKTVQPPADQPGAKHLVVRGMAVFGGLTIKN